MINCNKKYDSLERSRRQSRLRITSNKYLRGSYRLSSIVAIGWPPPESWYWRKIWPNRLIWRNLYWRRFWWSATLDFELSWSHYFEWLPEYSHKTESLCIREYHCCRGGAQLNALSKDIGARLPVASHLPDSGHSCHRWAPVVRHSSDK